MIFELLQEIADFPAIRIFYNYFLKIIFPKQHTIR